MKSEQNVENRSAQQGRDRAEHFNAILRECSIDDLRMIFLRDPDLADRLRDLLGVTKAPACQPPLSPLGPLEFEAGVIALSDAVRDLLSRSSRISGLASELDVVGEARVIAGLDQLDAMKEAVIRLRRTVGLDDSFPGQFWKRRDAKATPGQAVEAFIAQCGAVREAARCLHPLQHARLVALLEQVEAVHPPLVVAAHTLTARVQQLRETSPVSEPVREQLTATTLSHS